MRKFLALFLVLAIAFACGSNGMAGQEYICEKSNGKTGATLRFKKGGKMFLDLISKELAERNSNLQTYLNVAGEYEIVDDMVIVKYYNGNQTHTLNKVGDKLTSNTDIFTLCSCKTK